MDFSIEALLADNRKNDILTSPTEEILPSPSKEVNSTCFSWTDLEKTITNISNQNRHDIPCDAAPEKQIDQNSKNTVSSSDENKENAHKRPVRKRTAFTCEQIRHLEKHFHTKHYVTVEERLQLAGKLGLPETKIRHWFQNRRTRWKKTAQAKRNNYVNALTSAPHHHMFSPFYGPYVEAPNDYVNHRYVRFAPIVNKNSQQQQQLARVNTMNNTIYRCSPIEKWIRA